MSNTSLSILLLIALAATTFILSCKTTQEVPEDLTTLTEEIKMQKNPCFGKCPVYTLTIHKGGIATFDGRKFVEKYGIYTKVLSKKEYKKIKKAFNAANFWTLDDDYPSNISDLPKTRLSFTKDGKTKTVVGDIRRPKVVKDLDKMMAEIGNSDGWTLRSVPKMELPDYYITDELIVAVKPSISMEEWVKNFSDFDLSIVKEIGRNRNMYLLKYDESKIQPALIMNKLLMDEAITVLEFNKEVKPRQ